jgi:hypothetical protein
MEGGGVGGKEEDAAADEHAQQQMAELKAEIMIKDALIQSLREQLARYGAAHASAPAPSRPLSPAPAAKAVAKNTFVAAAAVVPGDMFLFSSRLEHRYSDVKLSLDRLTVTRPSDRWGPGSQWARSERGAAPGCGVVRWALRLRFDEQGCCDDEARDHPFRVGVCSDYFSGYTEHDPVLCHCFKNQDNEPFAAGDVVTLELERKSGVDVLRVRVEGKKPQSLELKGVPRDSMLYPIVCISNEYQSYTMVPVPPQ